MEKKTRQKFLLSEIIASELVLLNCPCEEDNTFHHQCMC